MFFMVAFVIPSVVVAQDAVDRTDVSSGVVEISVQNDGFDFIPSEIRVNEGVTVRLTFENTGGQHDWVLDEFDAATKVIRRGQSETIEFVADRAGEYEFYCSVPGHRARGMWGNFIVE